MKSAVAFRRRALLDDGVDQAELLRVIGGHEGVTLHDFLDLFQRLAGMLLIDSVEAATKVENFLCMDLDVAGLALEPATRLVRHNARVRHCSRRPAKASG